MTVCKFYQRGNCKSGDKCRFEHPGSEKNQFGGGANYDGYDRRDAFGGQSRGSGGGNPFTSGFGSAEGGGPQNAGNRGTSGFGNSGSQRNDGRGGERGPTDNELRKYLDDTLSKGLWGLTGFGLDHSASVVNGDLSPEEVRLQAYVSEKSGRPRIEVSREEHDRIQGQRQKLEGLSSGFSASQQSPPSFASVDFASLFKNSAAGSVDASSSVRPSSAFPGQGEVVHNPQQSAPFAASNNANMFGAPTSQTGAVFGQHADGAAGNKPSQIPSKEHGRQGFAVTSGSGWGGITQPFASVSNALEGSAQLSMGGFRATQPVQSSVGQQPVAASVGQEPAPETGEQNNSAGWGGINQPFGSVSNALGGSAQPAITQRVESSTGQQPVAASVGQEPAPQTGEQNKSSVKPIVIQEFQAAEFTLGKVPEAPPAPQYC
eukprot:CAMPEP_0184753078 /NCGR_PEP_ID=MMETSP0315-20130426/43915_1 /TAXON_ID=101924 /ORGANISM="Rhodosorus marinus, Strain UTEX LB 2760" /LENGTH=430 /DNA_ID=CAMNT_0027232443 /DNA_START=78 /DNA_END=1371 /DNA_ORIENTATION=-